MQNLTKIAPETGCNVITGATMANGLEKLYYREKSEVFIQILEGMKQTPVIVLKEDENKTIITKKNKMSELYQLVFPLSSFLLRTFNDRKIGSLEINENNIKLIQELCTCL